MKHARQSAPDVDTRSRIIDAATGLFVARGFAKVTVRDITRDAGVNLAAVSYHFGDKLGLYLAVVDGALEVAAELNTRVMDAPAELSPEQALRHYVSVYLPLIIASGERTSGIQKLVGHEMADPTPAARRIMEKLILPRIEYLCRVIAQIIGGEPDDERVRRSAMSIQAQCLFYAPDKFKSAAFPGWPPTDAASIDAASNHIIEFSLAGIRGLR